MGAVFNGQEPLHIAIIGAGIGGLSLANGLLRQGVSYTLYEAAKCYSAVGAGVGLGPNAIHALDAIDHRLSALYNDISSGNVTPGKDHVMMDGMLLEEGFGEKRGLKPIPYGAQCYNRTSAHRKALLDILTSGIPINTVKFNYRVKSIDQKSDRVVIAFDNGEVVEASCVIGCDGVKGVTRPLVLGQKWPDLVKAKYTGRYVYRAVVPMEKAMEVLGKDCLGNEIAGDARMMMHEGAIITTFPISRGKECNMVAFKFDGRSEWPYEEWTHPVSKETMVKDFEELGVDQRMIRFLDWATPLQWSVHDHPETPIYYNHLICLLGDSAHATTPHQASGAGQCIEDAFVLSRLLGLVAAPTQLDAAFRAYDSIRRPRAQKVVQTSREAADIFTLKAPGIGADMNKIVANMNERFLWIWDHDLLADAEKAKSEFYKLTETGKQRNGSVELKSAPMANVEEVQILLAA
ncbi:FAD/NAD(P)-binding domain-containing protein [Rhizodiscina lignyota]|uniref:FAD/NAD(P)-binding domain-containing protein n=1 Tax=Rhizodiscina lignyota TaxID=1504668 RepID=A0A9P4IBL9_9PEZI|nr:FAD/NAD(P)-binding domain-containing protein [Rhizodiscina lignyota]